MELPQVIEILKQQSNTKYLSGMVRFGIVGNNALGVRVPEIRKLAKIIGKNHDLAAQLWSTGIHEARLLATMIDDPALVTPAQMDSWVNDLVSWDICDQACGNLFDRTPYVLDKALEYSKSEKEYVKRAGFVLMAEYAVHDKKATDDVFLSFLPLIEREAWDNRNFVKKAVNWALRQIGKRNSILRHAAIECTKRVLAQDAKAAKWIAKDALKELAFSKRGVG